MTDQTNESTEPRRKKITSDYPALVAALKGFGIDLDVCRRIVIDIKGGQAPVVYAEMYGDETVINVVEALASVEIERK